MYSSAVRAWSVMALLLVLANAGTLPAATVFVDASAAAGPATGRSWAEAFPDLQDGLAAAAALGPGSQVWVAAGRYRPDRGTGDRTSTFRLLSGVALLGGFSGVERAVDDRDPALNETILSGDLLGNDQWQWGGEGDNATKSDNAHHVVTASGVDRSAVLDGFTIASGRADGAHERGGGMFNAGGSPTVRRCLFRENHALSLESSLGGGMYNEGGSLLLSDCTFRANSADAAIHDHGAGNGGAIASFDTDLELVRCTLTANQALGNDGGAIFQSGGNLSLNECHFGDNGAHRRGGALFLLFTPGRIADCTFDSNYAHAGGGLYATGETLLVRCVFRHDGGHGNDGVGGALCLDGGACSAVLCTFAGCGAVVEGGAVQCRDAELAMTGCSLVGGAAPAGSAIHAASGSAVRLVNCTLAMNWLGSTIACQTAGAPCRLEIANSILWDDATEIAALGDVSVSVAYSLVRGGWPGEGNLAADPQFVDPDGWDDNPGSDDDDVRLRPNSPAIDAGGNSLLPADALDLDGDGDVSEPVPLDCGGGARRVDAAYLDDRGQGEPPVVDIGAYEYTGAPPPAARLYVRPRAAGTGDGSSWGNALGDLDRAMETAYESGIVEEVWTAAGTYRPSRRTDERDPRTATFRLINGLALYGGFAGWETSLGQRECLAHPSVLDGDLAGNDPPGAAGDHLAKSENAYHVVTGTHARPETLLDGFVITGGVAAGSAPTSPWPGYGGGAGLYCSGGSPTVDHCLFRDNFGVYGGALLAGDGCHSLIVNSVFANNGVLGEYGNGGAAYCIESYPTFANCTIVRNTAPPPPACGCAAGGIACSEGVATVVNCVVWGNEHAQLDGCDVLYSCVQGGADGEGNIDLPPRFVGEAAGDFRLRADSPCVDAGSNGEVRRLGLDLQGLLRIAFGRQSLDVDLGACEHGSAPFEIVALERDSDGVLVIWTSQPGQDYTILARPDLGDALWPWSWAGAVRSAGALSWWVDPVSSWDQMLYSVQMN